MPKRVPAASHRPGHRPVEMDHVALRLHDRLASVSYPRTMRSEIDLLFSAIERADPGLADGEKIELRRARKKGQFVVSARGVENCFDRPTSIAALMDEVVRALIVNMRSGLALHAGMVTSKGRAILVPGQNGAGKTSLVGWLVDRGFKYSSDEIVIAANKKAELLGLSRAIVLKPGSAELVRQFPVFAGTTPLEAKPETIISLPPDAIAANQAHRCGLIVFPKFEADSDLLIEHMPPAQCAIKLMECNLNARNLRDDGVGMVAKLARAAPAISLRFGSYDQLEEAADVLMHFVLDNGTASRKLLRAMPRQVPVSETQPKKRFPVPEATQRRDKKSFTIGMATYDDYDGVFFSLQALQLYHGEAMNDVEMIVVDNHPDGPCSEALKQLENCIEGYRYVPLTAKTGTAVRDAVFDEANSDFVLCLDSHVLLVPGALKRLRDYYAANADTADLLQGPLVKEDIHSVAGTHMDPVWRNGFFGTWGLDKRGQDLDAPPFEIPMQGLGLFSCRRAAWPGFNPKFSGFGGEEGYIHEKFRQRGGRTLCLPFLRWMHRFARPMGIPYRLLWEDRIWNYTIGLTELGLPIKEMQEHFSQVIGADNTDRIIKSIFRKAFAR